MPASVTDLLLLTAVFSISVIAAFAVWYIAKRALARSALPDLAKAVISSLFKGPVAAAIVGYGLVVAVEQIDTVSPSAVPLFLKPVNLLLIIQLVVLALAL